MDVIERHRLHAATGRCLVEACIERDKHAKEAINLLAAGNENKGMQAAEQARIWEAKAKALLPK